MITPLIAYVRDGPCRAQSVHDLKACSPADLLRRERRVPLPGTGLRGAPVQPRRTARSGLAADCQRRARVRRLAPALAGAPRRRPVHRPPAGRTRRGARLDEQLLLPGDRPAAARDGVGHRVPSGDRAGRLRRPLAAQRRRARPRGGWRLRADGRPAAGRNAGIRLRLRQRWAVRALHRARAPRVAPFEPRGHRRPGHGDAARRAGGLRAGRLAGRASPARSGGARRRRRGGGHVLGHPVRVRPAGDGAACPRDLLADGLAAARHRHRGRTRRPGADADRPSASRCLAGRHSPRASPGAPGRSDVSDRSRPLLP
jgi:hypothetical protein